MFAPLPGAFAPPAACPQTNALGPDVAIEIEACDEFINVQGRKSRYRSADDVKAIVRANATQGVTRFFVTDDNFARNRNWEAILDRLIELREREKFRIKLILQVDTEAGATPRNAAQERGSRRGEATPET
jgi:hypothetical protein